MPAVVSGYRREGRGTVDDPPGKPVRFPPVWVNNRDQEEYYASLGYIPEGVSDPEKYKHETIGTGRPGPYEHQDFPRWMYQVGEDGAMKSALVDDADQMRLLGENWFTSPGDAKNYVSQESKDTEITISTVDYHPHPENKDVVIKRRGRPALKRAE